MGGRLRPASLHARRRASVLVPVNLLQLPDRAWALGWDWQAKEEHHVTAIDTLSLAERLGRTVEEVWPEIAAALAGRRAGPVRLGDELRLAEHDERRSIVLMTGVDGLGDLYAELSARLGAPLAPPPTHITLCTAPTGEAIGLATVDELRARSRRLGAAEDAEVRSALLLDEALAAGT
jgi:hypothetical protein